MAEIKDVSKLRPELLELSDAEFERRKAEFEMAVIERDRIKTEKLEAEKKARLFPLKQQIADAVMEAHSIDPNALPDWLVKGFTDAAGRVSAHRFLKVPRGN